MSLMKLISGAAGFFLGPAGAALGALADGIIQSNAAEKAANTVSSANDRAAQLQQEQFDKAMAVQQQQYAETTALQKQRYEEGVQRQQPFLTAGTNALARIQNGEFAAPAAFDYKNPEFAQPGAFSFGAGDYQADPGYAFRLSEGQKALERSAAARGGLISGGALKAATRYGQDMGSQEYGNAFNRALTQYGTKVDTANTGFNRAITGYNAQVNASNEGYNRLAGLAGAGQTTGQNLNLLGANYADSAAAAGKNYANSVTTSGSNLASNLGNIYSDTANAQGNALMAAANARSSAYGAAARLFPQMKFNNPFASNVSGAWNPATGTFGS
jgi:hypothetical protein